MDCLARQATPDYYGSQAIVVLRRGCGRRHGTGKCLQVDFPVFLHSIYGKKSTEDKSAQEGVASFTGKYG